MTSSSQNIRLGSGMFIGGVNQGRHYVYVKAGETIYVGSSAQGIGSGTINFKTPSGTVYSSGTDKVTGLIASRTEELAGPAALSPGGYKAYSKIVEPSEAGIWEIEFISPVPSATPNAGTTVLAANASWTSTNAAHQPTNNSLILAWDITVASSTGVQPGRTFLNVFTGNMGANSRAFNGKFHVLTIDGYRYLVEGNGMDPFVFAFFSNNNGVKSRTTGLPIYKSAAMVDVENNTNSASPSTTPYLYYPPENFGSGNDVTNKLFYQNPDLTMPTSASVNVGGSTVTTWLVNNVVVASISNIFISGSEGSIGVGTPPLGSYINFTASTNGNALVQLDGDNDGVYTGNKDRIILVAAKTGANKLYWDGKFKDGTYASTGLNLNLNVVIFNGEVHFPYVDAENNSNGFRVSRLNGNNSPDDKVYWDDSDPSFISATGESNPKTNITFPGLSSASNGHKWSSSYGDNRTLDTWAYMTTTSPVVTVPVVQNAADLAVTSISDVTSGSVGTDVTYTVVVKNIGGPNNVTGAKFKFSDLVSGANLAVQSFSSSSTLGGAVTAQTISGGVLDATVDLPKDATITFIIIGKILAPAGTNVNVKATIMRPEDLTDPDATADTHVGTPPVDPDVECDGTPSGVGCNNIKTDVFTVTSLPLPFPSTTNSCLGVFLSDVISSNPPTSIYKPATFTGDFIGRDNAINFAVGGNLTITNGAEYEGRSFVYGNFTMNKTSAFNLGVAGVGSFIVPDDNKNILTIGGNFDASAASGNLILGGEVDGKKSYGTIVYKGTKSPNVKITGDASKVINEATLDLTPYNDAFNALQVSSTAWNQLPSDPKVTFTNDGFGTYTFTCLTPSVSKSYVINIPNVLASRPNGTVNFVGFPDTASLLINVPGTTTNFNIATFQFNGVTQAVGSGNKVPANEVTPFSLRILWNLPTATTVSLKGAQFWGSMVIPQRTGTVTNEMIGMNGRFIVGGNLIQNIGGSETHNYPFKGEISSTDAPVVTTPVNYCQDETATALTATGSNLKWYTAQTGGIGSATAPTPSTTTVGTTTYYVTQTVGNCESARTGIDVIVKEKPVKPTTGTVTQPTCSVATGSFTISNYNAAYTYSVAPSTGVTISGATVTAPAGTYAVTATLETCSSVVSNDVVINAQPTTPVKPTTGTVTQPTCSVATGSFTISNYNAAYTYSVNPSTGVTISGATVTAPAGTYAVTATLGTCSSVVSNDVVINAQPTTPVKPTAGTVTQPTCSVATGSFTISNYNAAYTYSVNPSTGVTVSGATVTAPAGTYAVTATLGTCSSVVSNDVVIASECAGISVSKKGVYVDANADGIVNVGDRIDYTFTVTNTGNVTLAPVTITDANAVVSGSLASLAPGATDSSSFTAVHTITLADMNNGQVDNVATVSGTPPTGPAVTAKSTDPSPICATCPPKDPAACPSCTVVPLTSSPKVTVSKKGVYVDANADGIVNVGDRIDYTFTVTNTGNVTLAPVTITDANAVVSGSLASLAPGATDSSSFTAVHTITLADMNNGQVDNVATVSGTPPTGPAVTAKSTDPSPICATCPPKDPAACPTCTVVPLTSSPKVTVSKKATYVDANADGIVNVGDRIDYTFTVTNTGNVTLAPVTITDANAVVSGSLASLAPGATDSSSFTAVHTITLADMNNGQVDNVATVSGTPPTGPAVTAKSTDPSPICATCPPKDPAACPSCTVVPLTSSPKVTVSKKATYVDANADGIVNVGDRIDYTFTVTNTGNVTLAPVTITDANAVVSGSLASLAPGATDSSSFTAVHTITLADMNNGQVDNVATVSGTPPTGPAVTAKSTDPSPICATCPPKDPAACPSCTVVPLTSSPKVTVSKKATYVDANADGIVNVGDRIDYTFTVTNTGNVTLAPVTITDANAVVSGSLASLAPGATDSSSFTAVHTITLADMNNGQVDNVATVSGTPPTGPAVTAKSTDPSPICATCPPKDPAACPSCTVVPLTSSPKVTVSKKGVYVDANADGIVNVGDRIDYTFTVTNTGNVTLAPVTITDANAVVSGSLASLAPGATDSSSFTAVHTITLADMNNGQVDNVATVSGTPPTGPAVTAKSTDPSPICATCPPKDPAACPSCTVVPLTSSPKVTVSKKGVYVDANADGIVNVGDRIDYTFTVTNTGNVTLAPVTITDANAVVSGSLASLAPGATDSSSFTAVHTITLADMNNGQVDNVATVSGTPPTGPAVTAKSTDPSPICATCPPKDPAACPTCTVVPLTSSPKVTVSKKATYVDANADGIVNVGDRINYTFTVTNTGNVTLAPVTITDANAVVTGTLASLAPGATDSSSFTAVHTITLADMNNGQVDNVATVSGTPPTGPAVTAKSTDPSPICATCPPKDPAACPSCTVVPLTSSPKVTVSKKATYVDANADGIVNVGDRINYTFTVTNTGNVTLAPVTITDANAVVTGTLASLAPGATDSSSFTAVHTITLADMNNGQVDNVATVSGTPPTGPAVTAKSTDPSPICATCPPKDPAACPSCTVVPLTSSPKVTVSKKGVYVDANADGIVNVGDRIDYTFTVTNTGNVTLAPVTITDANAVVTGTLASLAPGATDSSSFTAVHTITLADMNNGQVDNVATVSGTPPTGPAVTAKSTDPSPICATCPPKDPAACPTCTVVPLTSSPKVTVSKKATYVDANADGIVNVGDRIDYTFTVTNTGNVTLAPVTITDANAVVTGTLASLAPGATDSSSFTAVHTITLADMNNGQVDNVATVSGTPPTGPAVTAKSTDPSPICVTCRPIDPTCSTCTVISFIDAIDETPLVVNGVSGGNTVSVLLNDKLHGTPVIASEVNLSVVSVPTGITLNTDGTIKVNAGTAPGVYTVIYSICSKAMAAAGTPMCDQAEAKITVTATVEPIFENGTIASTGGTVFTNIASNDKVNGVPAVLGTTGNATVAVSGTWPTGITLDPLTGKVSVAAGTTPGTYNVVYELCDKLTPTTCGIVSDEIKVTPIVEPIFENGTIASTGGIVFTNIASNDKVNGVPVVLGTTGNATIAVSGTWPTGITLDPLTGKVSVAAGTTPGTYNVVYELCDKLTPTTCATVSDEIKVTPIVEPIFENGTIASTGGIVFTNIASNDKVNGVPAVLGTTGNATIAVSGTWPTGITLDPLSGKVSVAAGTTPGTYNVVYQLCDKLTPVTCATVSDEIKVTPVVEPIFENGTIASTGGTVFTNIASNDKVNGVPAVLGTTGNATVAVSGTWPTGISLDPLTGKVSVAAGTTPGTYNVVYELCDKLTPATCGTVSDEIKVTATTVTAIVANDDNIPNANGITGTPNAGNVLAGNPNSDTLNGVPVVINQVDLKVITPAVPKTPGAAVPVIDTATGIISVPANTPGGTYTLTYSICEKSNLSNCDAATVTLFVSRPGIAVVKTAHFNDEDGDGNAKVGETITYNFTVTNTGNVALTNVYIVDPLTGVNMTGGPINLAAGEEDSTSFTGTYSIVQADINSGSISNQAEVFGTSPDNIVVKDKSDDSSVVGDKPTVLSLQGCVIKVFNAVSINGDNKNERFYIQGLECYPDNTVQIFNRWGVLVFDRDHYNNNDIVFRGISEGRVTIKDSDGLPEGTYYYIIKYKDNQSNPHQEAGYLYLTK
ncbi:hypothetical protein CFS9_34400 [Flavobacterium sp. CFS9]|uniref:DUF7507 domain-containing protein n=2 Tax=Flavobacterium sp. CFS9 TaxID=3143118 RepID=A0AAT9H5T3_9FLAO